MRLVLASESVARLPEILERWNVAGGVAFVPTAADGLDDRVEIVEPYLEVLTGATGGPVEMVDLGTEGDAVGLSALASAGLVFVGGGDPFHLLTRVRATGADREIRRVVRAGTPYVGLSAGAMLASPDLAPLRLTSPFAAPDGDLRGLALFDRLVLPHEDRPGRSAKHDLAVATHTQSMFVRLRDDQLLVVDDEHLEVVDDAGRVIDPDVAGVEFRAAVVADAAGMADVFTAAARAAWSGFLGEERTATFESPRTQWEQRVAALVAPAECRVAIDADGVAGFAIVGPATDTDLPGEAGELQLFYTHPRTWGGGVGRSLHRWAVAALRNAGFTSAVLWTEERNERPRRVYERAGWVLDGAVRERTWEGAPLRELRHSLTLVPESSV